jgi:hypothetical protein
MVMETGTEVQPRSGQRFGTQQSHRVLLLSVVEVPVHLQAELNPRARVEQGALRRRKHQLPARASCRTRPSPRAAATWTQE